MSNPLQGVTAIVGGVVGWFVGGPTGAAYGFQLGMLAGAALFPTQLPGVEGPRLTDVRQTTSNLGQPIMELWGTDVVPGTVIYLSKPSEHTHTEEVGGKGGPTQKQTTFTYTQSVGIGLIRYAGENAGILAIWENGELVYDGRDQGPDEDDATYASRVEQAAKYGEGLVFYTGSEDQMPDPTIEADKGVGNVPAFRGLMWVMMPDRLLRDDQARRLPNYKFLISTDVDSVGCIVEATTELLHNWGGGDNPANPRNINTFQVVATGYNHWAADPFGRPLSVGANEAGADEFGNFQTMGAARNAAAAVGGYPLNAWMGNRVNVTMPHHVGPVTTRLGGRGVDGVDPPYLYVHFNAVDADEAAFNADDGIDGVARLDSRGGRLGRLIYMDHYFTDTPGSNNNAGVFVFLPSGQITGPLPGWDDFVITAGEDAAYGVKGDAIIQIHRSPGPPAADPSHPWEYVVEEMVGFPPKPPYRQLQVYQEVGSWTKSMWDDGTLSYEFGNPTMARSQKPLGPVIHHEDPRYNDQAFWEAAYIEAKSRGDMPRGLVYGEDYPIGKLAAWKRERCIGLGTGGGVRASLAVIVRDLCLRAGLTENDIDVEELAERYTDGYVRTRPSPARTDIDLLRSVGFYDVVEADGKLCFRIRGGPPRATLYADDLGAFEAGTDTQDRLSTRMVQAVELPRMVRVHYRAPSHDYEDGEQKSLVRRTTDAVNEADLQLPCALPDDQAAKIAEVIYRDAWAGRWIHDTAVDVSRRVQPADPVLVQVEDRLRRMRIIAIDDSALLIRKLSLVRDDDGATYSQAVGVVPERPPAAIITRTGVYLEVLDLPALRDVDDNAGVYAAARNLDANATWRGATIFRSTDPDTGYVALASTSTQAAMGRVSEEIGAGITSTWDDASVLVVVLDAGVLESRPAADVIGGANAAAIGVNGRWEILQFRDVEQLGPREFKLTGLLRGRRGTESFVGTSVQGDKFVLLSGGGLVRLPLELAQLGVPMYYRAAADGQSIEEAEPSQVELAAAGVALRPLSPTALPLSYSDGYTLEWIRRSRVGRELQGGVDVPLAEETETYEVEFYDNFTLKATKTVTGPFLLGPPSIDVPVDLGALTEARIYQVSASVGRGPPAIVPITGPAAEGEPGVLPFVASYDDQPALVLVCAEGIIFTRLGKLGPTHIVGFYLWDGSDARPFANNYDGLSGLQTYVPSVYLSSANVRNNYIEGTGVPRRGSRRDLSHWAAYYRQNPVANGKPVRSFRKYLLTGEGDELQTNVPPTDSPVSDTTRNIVALMPLAAGGYLALMAMNGITTLSPLQAWSSTDGYAWTYVGECTGMPTFESLTNIQLFEWGGKALALTPFGIYVNDAADGVAWDGTSQSNMAAELTVDVDGAQFTWVSFDYSDTEIVIIAAAGNGNLGANNRRQKILRSTDGVAWTTVRNVPVEDDKPPGGLYNFQLTWDHIIRFGSGYIVYGRDSFSNALPFALVSTDGGETFVDAVPVDMGDSYSWISIWSVLSTGSLILAVDPGGKRSFTADREKETGPLASDLAVSYARLSYSTDGIHFSPLPGFPTE